MIGKRELTKYLEGKLSDITAKRKTATGDMLTWLDGAENAYKDIQGKVLEG